MKSSSQLGRKKAAVGIGAVLLLAASLVTVSATLNAQTNDCNGDHTVGFGTGFFGAGDYGNHLLSFETAVGGTVLAPVAIDLPAGTYVVNAVSTDGYVGRDIVSQPSERWSADFYDAAGNLLASTGVTDDVPDNVEAGYWTGQIGTIELSADATSVVARHAFPGRGNTPNSVRPVCLGFTDITPDPCAGAVAGDGAEDADGNLCVDPCADAAADGSDGAEDADGSPCVDPCADAVAGDGAIDAEGNACVEPCVDALVTAGISADDALAACAAADCVEDATAAAGADADGAAIAEACDEITVEVGGETLTNDGNDDEGTETGDGDDEVEPAVAGATITAPVAQAQTGNPTFTG